MDIENTIATNSPAAFNIYFKAGTHMQRPALTQPLDTNIVYAGFGSHCDANLNYTGWVIGIDVTTQKVTTAFALAIAAPDWQPPENDIYGPGAAIWMSGNGLVVNKQGHLLFTTGNGDHDFKFSTALNQVNQNAANAIVRFDPVKNQILDAFSPMDRQALDWDDLDLSSGGITMLPDMFNSANGHATCIAGGKGDRVFVVDCESLGGYSETMNNVLQDLTVPLITGGSGGSTWSNIAAYPGEGGFIYHNIETLPLRVMKFQLVNGVPNFELFAQGSQEIQFGGSSPMVTSLEGKEGSAIVWYADGPGGTGLNAYAAVPSANGSLTRLYQDEGQYNKFVQFAIGDGRVVTVSPGKVVVYG